jgi:hypothetical protein
METIKQNLINEVENIEAEIDRLWDDKSKPIEVRGRLIDFLAKKRVKLNLKIRGITLYELGYQQNPSF